MKFKTFTNKLLSIPSESIRLKINNTPKEIRAFVRLTSKNYLVGEYWKLRFTDGSFLLLVIQDEELYYSDTYKLHIKEIKDAQIGRDKILTYQGKNFKLGNKDDYQYVKELVYGSPVDIEGECRFSDYFPVAGEKEFLSLGWLSKTGKRADIHCKIIQLSSIHCSNNS